METEQQPWATSPSQLRNSQRGSSRPGPKCDKPSVGKDMRRPAVPSTIGDIVRQRRIDLAAAYRPLCRFSHNENINSRVSVSLPGPQDLFLSQSIRDAVWSRNRLQSHHSRYQLRQSRRSPPAGHQSGRLRHARAIHIDDARLNRLKTARTAYERSREDHTRNRRYGCDLG